jgi:hypothetical protein
MVYLQAGGKMILFLTIVTLGMASLIRKVIAGNRQIPWVATAAVSGAAVFGTIVWLIFGWSL